MRYFLYLSYNGTRFSGWQAQPNAPAVQSEIETAIQTILREPISIVGCGRTDAGVHARYYVAHFDVEQPLPPSFMMGMNSLIGKDIAIHEAKLVGDAAHARFDAYERSYEYHIALRKDPFDTETAWFFSQHAQLDLDLIQQAADLLPQFEAFFPFCKTHSGVKHYACQLKTARWEYLPESHRLVFHITANRFLRGMVRLIVGACLQCGLGKMTIETLRTALEQQKALPKSLSVPPQGLFLTDVKYPF